MAACVTILARRNEIRRPVVALRSGDWNLMIPRSSFYGQRLLTIETSPTVERKPPLPLLQRARARRAVHAGLAHPLVMHSLRFGLFSAPLCRIPVYLSPMFKVLLSPLFAIGTVLFLPSCHSIFVFLWIVLAPLFADFQSTYLVAVIVLSLLFFSARLTNPAIIDRLGRSALTTEAHNWLFGRLQFLRVALALVSVVAGVAVGRIVAHARLDYTAAKNKFVKRLWDFAAWTDAHVISRITPGFLARKAGRDAPAVRAVALSALYSGAV